MNFDSNHNPYSTIATADQSDSDRRQPIKGFVKVVCIFFIVLGSLGLLGTLQVIVSMVVMLFMDGNQFNPLTLFPSAMAISIGIAVINCVVSVLEIVGGVLGLKQKRSGANLIRFVSVFMLVFKIAETAFFSILNYLAIGPTIEQATKQMPAQPTGGPDVGMMVQFGMFAVIGLTIVIALVMFAFYLSSFLTFSKQKTLSQFS